MEEEAERAKQQPPPSQQRSYQDSQRGPPRGDYQSSSRTDAPFRPRSAQPAVPPRQSFPVEPTEDEKRLFKSTTNAGINFDRYDDIQVEVSGNNVIEPIESYQDVDLGPAVNRNVVLAGYRKPTPIQKHSIPIILGNRDLMACAQTGSGKTCAFLLPMLHRLESVGNFGGKVYHTNRLMVNPAALVIAPTRELCIQIFDEASKFSNRTNLLVCVCYGGKNLRDQIQALRRHGCDLLVATPGRLIDLLEQGVIGMQHISILCLDEADRMLDMGFEPQIRKIVENFGMPPKTHRQTVMFSATFPKEIQRLAALFLADYLFCVVGTVGETAKDITQKFELVRDGAELDTLMDILPTILTPPQKAQSGAPSGPMQRSQKNPDELNLVLIFTETKREANSLEIVLNNNGYPTTSIHGDRSQDEREDALYAFKSGIVSILVATDVASRGLDIPSVRTVINYSMPNEMDRYVHRIGRTGRVGHTGTAITFIKRSDGGMIPQLIESLEQSNQEIPAFFEEIGGRRYGMGSGGGRKFGNRDARHDDRDQGGSYKRRTFTHSGRGRGGRPGGDPYERQGGGDRYGDGGSRGYGGGRGGGYGSGGGSSNDPYPVPSPTVFSTSRPENARTPSERSTTGKSADWGASGGWGQGTWGGSSAQLGEGRSGGTDWANF
ncbi:putative ATP-dependent RNA helicase DDX3Y [Blattamonas nauphoetae]|uniref:RNA helicase n=1 Tax=Blattamonas nauphoetae TaxID=2049346 RepID=A0ABQ9XFF7_9EUKA|nr:putative ATP-dependent RNA helicase DDX3Y [Blattamonas nauphoetae]